MAPKSPLEESATTEASRRCSLNGMLNGIRGSFWGRVLEAFATTVGYHLGRTLLALGMSVWYNRAPFEKSEIDMHANP